jgi:hypothetical protein
MKTSAIYSTLAKSAAKSTLLAALAVTALVGATAAQARPHYIQDVQYVQVAPQVVITPPQLVVQTPVFVQPAHVRPSHVYPSHVRPVVVQHQAVYGHRFVPGRIYYIHGRPFLNGHPYVRVHGNGHYKPKHIKHHHDRGDRWDRHDGRHDEGRRGGSRH